MEISRLTLSLSVLVKVEKRREEVTAAEDGGGGKGLRRGSWQAGR